MKIGKFSMLFVGIILLRDGKLTVGGLMVFISVFEQLGGKVADFGHDFLNMYECCYKLKFKKKLFSINMSEKRQIDNLYIDQL